MAPAPRAVDAAGVRAVRQLAVSPNATVKSASMASAQARHADGNPLPD